MGFNPLPFFTAIQEIKVDAETTFGLFHDTAQGWIRLSSMLEGLVSMEMRTKRITREQALNAVVIHGQGEPETGIPLHESTLGEAIKRASPHGPNEILLGNMCLVSIYTFWDVRGRSEIAKALGIENAGVSCDLYGDLRHIRHMLIHNGGYADKKADSLKLLRWYKPGDRIVTTRQRLHEIVEAIRTLPQGLRTEGFDPTH